MAQASAILGSWAFGQYVRVDQAVNPYPTFEDPSFGDAPFAEGQRVQALDVKNREMVFPLFLNAATAAAPPVALPSVVSQAILACKQPQQAGPLPFMFVPPGGATYTMYDVGAARFEPGFDEQNGWRRSEKGWLAGNLRMWMTPPYGHTGTDRIVATTVQLPIGVTGNANGVPSGISLSPSCFADWFDNGFSNAYWTVTTPPAAAASVNFNGGSVMWTPAATLHNMFISDTVAYPSYYTDVRLTAQVFSGGSVLGESAGLSARLKDASNFLFGYFQRTNNIVGIGKYEAGVRTYLATAAGSGMAAGSIYWMRFTARGNQLTFEQFLGGTALAPPGDPSAVLGGSIVYTLTASEMTKFGPAASGSLQFGGGRVGIAEWNARSVDPAGTFMYLDKFSVEQLFPAGPVGAATLYAGSVMGDAAPLYTIKTDVSGLVPGPLGRALAFGLIPTGYNPWIPAASLQAGINATMFGASGAPGSQALIGATQSVWGTDGEGPAMYRAYFAASPYAGRNRVFAIVHPMSRMGQHISAVDLAGNLLGPTAVARSEYDGWKMIDLGVLSVPTTVPTFGLTVSAAGRTGRKLYDRTMGGATMVGIGGAHAGLIILPEPFSMYATDPGYRIAEANFSPSYSSVGTYTASPVAASYPAPPTSDDYGNPLAYVMTPAWGLGGAGLLTGTVVCQDVGMPGFGLSFWGPAAASQFGNFFAVQLTHPAVQDSRKTMVITNKATGNYNGAFFLCDPDFRGARLSVGPLPYTGSGWLLSVQSPNVAGATVNLGPETCIPSQAGLYNGSYPLVMEVVDRENQMYVNLRLVGTNIPVLNALGSVNFVPAACHGMQAATVGRARSTGKTFAHVSFLAGGGSPIAAIHQVAIDRLPGGAGPAPSDRYTVQGYSGEITRTAASGGAVVDLTAQARGPKLVMSATRPAQLVVFDAMQDGGPMNDPMAVEVRVRERFSFGR